MQAWIEHQLRFAAGPALHQMPTVTIAHGKGGEAIEAGCPLSIDPVPCAVISEACGIGNQPARLDAVAEEQRLAAVPRVTEVPDLVAADDDGVIVVHRLRLVQREAFRKRQRADRRPELACLGGIEPQFRTRRSLGQLGLQCATRFRAADALAVVVEQFGVVAVPSQPFDEAAGLPVGAIVDRLVKGEDANSFHATGHARPMRARGAGSDLQRGAYRHASR